MQSSPVTSLYAHIPFCSKKCGYCAFVTHVGSLKLMAPYLEALTHEAQHLANQHPGGPLTTLYFGGGTPSLMSPRELDNLLALLDSLFGIDARCEITLEAHPDTVNLDKLREFKACGVTRISFGAESMRHSELQSLGRLHNPEQVINLITQSRDTGFDAVNVDLMYGTPGQTLPSWRETLLATLAPGPDHLSLYPLSIEPKTVFARKWRENLLSLPGDESVVAMYELACRTLRSAGYEHYEVANWSLPGKRCRHNLGYWNNCEFYSIGVGAHGYLRPYRTENRRQTTGYIRDWLVGQGSAQVEVYVNEVDDFTETVMLRLRLLQDGLDLAHMRHQFGIDIASTFSDDIDQLSRMGLIRLQGNRLLLEESAVPIANEIWSRFVLDPDPDS